MAGIRSRIARAAATHRRAVAIAAAADAVLGERAPGPRDARRRLRRLAGQLTTAAAALTPGWLGCSLDPAVDRPPTGTGAPPWFIRIGTGPAVDDVLFPVVVPLGHLAFDADARDHRVAGALRAVLLRLLATAEPGTLLVRLVDPGGAVAEGFAPLHDAGIMPPPVTDPAGLEAELSEAELWVRGSHPGRTLLLILAAWPPPVERAQLARLAALAGSARGLHLLVAGWMPELPLPGATRVRLGDRHAVVGHPPPGGQPAVPAPPGPGWAAGLHTQVRLDPAPPAALVAEICARLARQTSGPSRIDLPELLPDGPLWAEDGVEGLAVTVGRAGSAPVTLRLGGASRHCLIGGRSRSGKTALLHCILYGLAGRYDPGRLGAYLLDPADAGAFPGLAALPHVRGTAVGGAATASLLAELVERTGTGRVLCVVDGLHALPDPGAHAALRALSQVEGLHLVLAGEGVPPGPVAELCRIRIALPGGRVLDPANDAAAGLALGQAVVNTAGGLGGPRGATRAHEQRVHFPDPRADPVALAELRRRLSMTRSGR